MSIPIPSDLARGRVSWTIGRAPAGTALPGARGAVVFEPTAVAVNYDSATILPEPVTTPVVSGVMTPVDLIQNDPELWNWKVTPKLGVFWGAFHIDVAGPVNLAQAAVVPGVGPVRVVKGDKGDDGPSAYDLYRASTTDDPPLSEAEWLASLKGKDGDGALPAGVIPIFPTLAEAQSWEAANPGGTALTIESQEPDVTPPVAGTLGVVVSDISATLTVTGASDDRAIAGYAFRRGTGVWSEWQVGAAFTMAGLTPATSYDFQHKVRDGAGNETLGAVVTRTTAAMAAKTPAEIGNLWGHWDASVPGSLTTSGTAVSGWTGVTANARTASQADTAKQPATTTMAGKTAVQFDRATSDYLRHQSSFTIDANVGYTLCWVGRFDDADVTVSQAVASFNGATALLRRTPDGLLSSGANPTLDGPASQKPTAAGQVIMMAVVAHSGGSSFVWISGVPGTTKTGTAGSPTTAFDLGRSAANAGFYSSATVGETWVHNKPLSLSELDALRLYAQQKWGAV